MTDTRSVRFLAFNCPAAPAGRQWMGQIFITPRPTPKNENPGEFPLNLLFWAGNRTDAISAAEAWWRTEQQKIADREAGAAERAAKSREARNARRAA